MRKAAEGRGRRVRSGFRPAPVAVALLATALALLATVDDRHAGRISDECQMGYTAIALVETGSIALGLDPHVSNPAPSPRGDYVSRYGMASSLVQLPAAFLAGAVEKSMGPGASNPLFLVAPMLLLLASGWAASRIAAQLGGPPAAAGIAVVLATVASPLGNYSAAVLSEPLQAACLSGALACSLGAALAGSGRRSLALSAACGFLIGAAILSKSVLAVVAAPLALPLLAAGGWRRIGPRAAAAAAGFLGPAVAWTWFEARRFGTLLGGYTGESFSHPVVDGLLRLLVMPNYGVLLFYPALVLAIAAMWRVAAEADAAPARRLAAVAASASFLALLLTSAAWWCWYGNGGWGPRFLVPSIPLVAPFAAIHIAGWPLGRRTWGVGICLALNLPPLFAHPSVVRAFTASCPNGAVTAERASEFPSVVVHHAPDGRSMLAANHVLAYVPSAAPHVVFPWFAWASLSGKARTAADLLRRPPWLGAEPALVPPPFLDPDREIPWVAPAFRWGWGRTFFEGSKDPANTLLYVDGLRNQVLRLLDHGPAAAAVDLSRKLLEISGDHDARAFHLEALRIAGMRETASDAVGAMSPRERSWPLTAAAIALFLRDIGQPGEAQKAMRVARAGGGSVPYGRFAAEPPSSWPPDLLTLRGRYSPN